MLVAISSAPSVFFCFISGFIKEIGYFLVYYIPEFESNGDFFQFKAKFAFEDPSLCCVIIKFHGPDEGFQCAKCEVKGRDCLSAF